MNIEETIASMTQEQIAQETENYRNKLTAVNAPFHHNAKLSTLN